MIRLVLLPLFCLALGTMDGVAQNDRPWWKSLFNGESKVHNSPNEEPHATPPAEEVEPPVTIEENALEEEVHEGFPELVSDKVGVMGSVQWRIPENVAALDSAQVDPESIRIPGFRVQLFMGRLDSARSLRQVLMQDERLECPIYVTPYPPLFGVTMGNFTSYLAAYRLREKVLSVFPQSLVVPLNLPLNAVYPKLSNGNQSPQLEDIHRD